MPPPQFLMSLNVTVQNALIGIWLVILLACGTAALAEDATSRNEEAAEGPPRREATWGLLPQLGIALRLPESAQLYGPDGPRPPDQPLTYNRLFPIGAEELINQGYALPLPIGVTLIGVDNTQGQDITDMSVALGKGVVPPEDQPLKSIPFVNINSLSLTKSGQVKADLWVLPFLNLYATVGKLDGQADLNVNVNLDDIGEICIPNPVPSPPGQPEKPPICIGSGLTGTVTLPITTSIDRTTATLGLTGAYSVRSWFGSLTASYTESYGDESSDIETTNAGFRFGRRLAFGNQNLFSPYAGVSYLDLDTRVSGVATLKDAFPSGEDLNVRYDAKLDNQDKFAGVLGFNIGLRNGTAIQAEWNKSARSERWVLSGQLRF